MMIDTLQALPTDKSKVQQINQKLIRTFKEINDKSDVATEAKSDIDKLDALVSYGIKLILKFASLGLYDEEQTIRDAPLLSSEKTEKKSIKKMKRFELIQNQSQAENKEGTCLNTELTEANNESMDGKELSGLLDCVAALIDNVSLLTKAQKSGDCCKIQKYLQQLLNSTNQLQSTLLSLRTDLQCGKQRVPAPQGNKSPITQAHSSKRLILNSLAIGSSTTISKPQPTSGHSIETESQSSRIIKNLQQQIQVLSEALLQNDKNYDFVIKKYSRKLQNSELKLQQLQQKLRYNEAVYYREIDAIQTKSYEDELLIENMARKIRDYERQMPEKITTPARNLIVPKYRPNNYACLRLSREKNQLGQCLNFARPRSTSIENESRLNLKNSISRIIY